MHRSVRNAVVMLAVLACALPAQNAAGPVERRTTANHPMRYLVSRPVGWKAGGSYPVVVAIEAADREFDKTMQAFIAARGKRPYVIVVPEVVTAGPTVWGPRRTSQFDYDSTTWQRIYAATDCGFDAAGMTALVADIKRLDSPTGSLYLTGWEAGGHVVLAQLFKHPGTWTAVAPIAPNYIGRCMEDRKFVNPGAAGGPPVRLFYSASDSASLPGGVLHGQWAVVQRIAAREGFTHLSEQAVKGTPRGPMPVEVLAWLDSLRAAGGGGH